MSRYLVTGASGFIGRALCRALVARGHRVRAVLRSPCDGTWQESLVCDLATQTIAPDQMRDIDGIFHLASRAHAQDLTGTSDDVYWRINVDSTRALVDVAARSQRVRRFVYFSSVKAAADPGADCVDETWDLLPKDAYGRTKREAERLVLTIGDHQGMEVCILRPTLVYGPGVKGNLAQIIGSVRRGTFPPLPEFGNKRSMVGLDDLVAAAWLAMTGDGAQGQTYIVADGIPYSTRGVYEAIRRALGLRVPEWTVPRWAFYVGARCGDALIRLTHFPIPLSSAALQRLSGSACYKADRLRRELGWQPKQTFFANIGDIVRLATIDSVPD